MQYKTYDSYSRSELQGQLGRPLAVRYLYYSTKSFLCQVNIVLICFVYFTQCFIIIFCATTYSYIFARFIPLYIKEETPPQKCNLAFKILVLQDILRQFFLRAFIHTKHKLIQLYHIIHLTICQVNIV